MRQSKNKRINKKLEKDITWEQIQEIMRPRIEALQESIKYKKQSINIKMTYSEQELKTLYNQMPSLAETVLSYLKEDWTLTKTGLYHKIGKHNTKIQDAINWLIDKNLVVPIKFIKGKTLPAEYFPLTGNAHSLLKTPLNQRKPTPALFKHSLAERLIADGLKKQGFEPIVEFSLSGFESFTIDNYQRVENRIDVFAKQNGIKVAYEIFLTDFYYIDKTIYKCFMLMQMNKLVIVCEDKDSLDKAKRRVNSYDYLKNHKDIIDQIEYKKITDFV